MISTLTKAGTAGGALVAAIVLAGCGGDDDATSGGNGTATGSMTSQQVVECLKTSGKKTGFTVSESEADLDSVAKRATDRAVALDVGGKKAIVIIQRTEEEAGKIVDEYGAGPASERGAGYAQHGSIVVADKDYGITGSKQGRAITDCVKFGTKQ